MENNYHILYSTKCWIRSAYYRLYIVNIDGDVDQCDINHSTSDSSTFGSTKISVEDIKPSITRIRLELIDDNKEFTSVNKTITIDHLLNAQEIQNRVPHYPRLDSINTDSGYLDDQSTCTTIHSRRTSTTTVDSALRERAESQSSFLSRPFSISRFFSVESSNSIYEVQPRRIFRSFVNISYVDTSDPIHWMVKRLQLKLDNEQQAKLLSENLNLCLSMLKQRPRRLLVFVNPCCGKGRGPAVYNEKILPLFEEAKILVCSIHTESANEAKQHIMTEDLTQYDGLICVGGDGMFAELCHGLLLRTIQEANLNIDDPNLNLVQPKLRIGIIPAGSTDAVVFGTTGFNDPVTSALQIIVGESLPIDISTIHNENGFVRFMAAMLAYGFFGDIIRQSDEWRCLGPLRYDLAGFCQFIRKKSYPTQIRMKLVHREHPEVDVSSMISEEKDVKSSCAACLNKVMNCCHLGKKRRRKSDLGIRKSKKKNVSVPKFCHRHCETCAIGSKQTGDPNQSSTFEKWGHYTTINCLNMPGRCAKSKFGMSPYVHLGDGSFDLILVKDSWRASFLRFLWQVANDSSNIENLSNVEKYAVSEVCIEPSKETGKRIGSWACDGELISGKKITIRVHRQALCLFASGIHAGKSQAYMPINMHGIQTKF